MKVWIFCVLFFPSMLFSQVRFDGIGISFGGGAISGNSPSITAYTASLFFRLQAAAQGNLFIQGGYRYARDFDILLPEDRRNKYYPIMQEISISAVITDYVLPRIFIGGGGGISALNDRMFADTDVWGFGIKLSAEAGIEFFDRMNGEKGLTLSFGTDYVNTFTGTNPRLFSGHVMLLVGL